MIGNFDEIDVEPREYVRDIDSETRGRELLESPQTVDEEVQFREIARQDRTATRERTLVEGLAIAFTGAAIVAAVKRFRH